LNHVHKENFPGEVFIRNTSAKKSLVVLLPVTRVGEMNVRNWERILQVIAKSEVVALVVLDKTPSAEATEFFSTHENSIKSDIYLVRRTPGEAIYDSQSVVTIDRDLWILQLHDDDEWGGVLSLPSDPKDFELFSPNFILVGKHGSEVLGWESSPPARINFTALPASVWNRFTLFIRSQGGHAAGSVDATLNLMSRLICEYKALETFDYKYNNRHWENQKQAKGNLEKLAREDGWENLSSEEFQLLNRRIDALSALIFFHDLMSGSIENERLILIRDFKLSRKKRIHLRTRFFVYQIFKYTMSVKLFRAENSDAIERQNFIRNRINVDRLILLSTKVRTQQDVMNLVKLIQDSGEFPLLKKRFEFWAATFQ
jgi:hypothetical protein